MVENSHFDGCHLTALAGHINVSCSYLSNSTATGFQVIAQRSSISETYKLYTGKTTDRVNPVTVQVGSNGDYEVSIFAITGDMGMLLSNVEYREHITVVEITSNQVL